ncbi:MAG: Nodulation protein NfeD [Chloroflexi bacterium]|nr:Nodulation protein NfeD [Chloroflexota bacterium]
MNDRARPGRLILALGAMLLALSAAGSAAAASGHVVVLRASGVVDSVLAAYIAEGVGRAERDGAAAVVIGLDTPGGSLDATQDIVSTLLEATIPTIVWVSPAGARAASAGTFITLAAHLAYMAPGTNIGAASPIDASGGDIEGTLGEKVLNDAIAKMRAIAQERGRNEAWAVETVTNAKSSPASEAVAVGAVDGLAASLDEVFAAATGRELVIAGRTVRVDLVGAATEEAAMNPFQGFLHLLSDPNIAFLLFTIGFYGLIFELQNPNFVTGILGAFSIILALIGFGSLPLNVAGLLLLGLGVILLALETTVTSHGLLTVGGVICFALGASALYTTPGDPLGPIVAVAQPLLWTMSLTTAAFGALIAWAALRSRSMVATPGTAGAPILVGSTGVVRGPTDPLGSVFAAGEEWTARTRDGSRLERGAGIRVVAVEGLTLVVEPEASSSESA